MILPPKDFGPNDWFIIGWLIIMYAIVWRLPRRLPRSVSLLVMLFSLSLAKGSDNTLGTKPLDLYDTNQIPKFDWTDLLTWALYPAFGYVFVHLYDRCRVRGYALPAFIVACSLFASGFEYVSVLLDVFTYKSWNLAHSFIVYLWAQSLTILFFEWMKRIVKQARDPSSS